MIGSVGHQANIYALFQAQQSRQAKSATPTLADPFQPSDDSSGDDASSIDDSQNGPVGAGEPASRPLSASTLSSLLGLQMVNGQVQGGASGAELNLPQITLPSGMDPTALLNGPTLLALQSIGS